MLPEGMSFLEESCGTNAVAISRMLKKDVYTIPQHHYCSFLEEIHICSKPLLFNGNIHAYIVLFTQNQTISKELLAICELLRQCIKYELSGSLEEQNQSTSGSKISLNRRQREILLLFASGMTDKAVAIERKICIDTVKYHKKNIFNKLNATCTIQAVMKAIKQNIISIEEINL